MITRTPLNHCPSCNHKIDSAGTLADESKPEPGNLTVCMYCGHVMAFADDLTLRELTEEEKIEAAGHPEILEIQKARAAHPIKEIHTKDKLAAALHNLHLHRMAKKAAEGYYHDFLSPLATPEIQLVNDLAAEASVHPKRKDAILALRSRVINGDFDATKEESDEWAASPEGQEAFRRLMKD